MVELIEILRAKSGEQSNYLLKEHLKEAALRALDLYKFVNENGGSFNYSIAQNNELFEKLVVSAVIHDLGKIDYGFQNKVFNKLDKETEKFQELRNFLSPLNNPQINYPRHEILSTIWSIFLINNTDLDKKVRTAILLHHYNEYFIAEKDLMEIIFSYKRAVISYLMFIRENADELNSFLNQLFEYIQKEIENQKYSEGVLNIGISALTTLNSKIDTNIIDLLIEKIESHEDDISEFAEFYEIKNEDPDYDFLVFLGFLRRCDYSSSGNVDIERGDLKEVFNGLSGTIKDNISKDKSEIYLWQKEVLEKIDSEKSLVLVAPTGSGKTEFALIWAENNKRKLLYTLPLRVALNDLFSRFGNPKEGYFKGGSVDILHSTAFIEYMKEEKDNKKLDMDKKITSTKMLSSPVVLTTPDQIFLTSLNYYGSDKVISLYPFSSVVIDEIQTYNEEMAAIILKTLEIIHKLNGKVLIITATFPPYFEKFFDRIFGEDLEIVDVATLDTNTKSKIKNFDLRRHKIKVVEDSLFKTDSQLNEKADLTDFINEFNDKNLFLVVNNVGKAINLFKALEDEENVYLLHSRLIEREKSRRIKEIKDKIENGEKVTVVATQIIEASVDLDFDVMITEISTIDSQVQRWGRVHRNRDANYVQDNPNIIIFSGECKDGSLNVDKGTAFVYDIKVIEKTFEVLKEYELLSKSLNYEEERKMINDVFKREIEGVKLKCLYEDEIEKILDYLNYFTVEKKSQAQKLFRDIAGYKLVVPDLIKLKEIDNKFLENFAEILKGGDKQSWREVIDQIKENTGEEKDIWALKKVLYENSLNVPLYHLEKSNFWGRGTHEFKGFYIWNTISEESLNSLKEYGLDSIFNEKDKTEFY